MSSRHAVSILVGFVVLLSILLIWTTTCTENQYMMSSSAQIKPRDTYQRCYRSVVTVTAYFGKPDTAGGYEQCRTGTGFFVSQNREIVTASHLVYGPLPGQFASHVVIGVADPGATPGDRRYVAVLLGVDGRGDVAVLQITDPSLVNIPVPPIVERIGVILPGDSVMMIGNPLGLDPLSCSVGVVRDQYWTDPTLGLPLIGVMTDIRTSAGNSGSPVFTADGRVVSMHTDAQASDHQSITSFGGGIASWHLHHIVQRIIEGAHKDRKADTPFMFGKLWFREEYGLVPNTHAEFNHLLYNSSDTVPGWSDVDGFLVTQVERGSPLQIGDVLTHLDGVAIGITRTGHALGDIFWYMDTTITSIKVTIVRSKKPVFCTDLPVMNICGTIRDVSDQPGDQAGFFHSVFENNVFNSIAKSFQNTFQNSMFNSVAKSFTSSVKPWKMIHLKLQGYANTYLTNNPLYLNQSRWAHVDVRLFQTFGAISTTHAFFGLADVYDNSLTILYFTAIDDFVRAKHLADSWLQILVWAGWNTQDANTDMQLLRARYRPDGTSWSEVLRNDSLARDVGNNAYMGIALVKFGGTYHKSLYRVSPSKEEDNIYTRAGASILQYIHEKRYTKQNAIKGYMAREAPKDYLSTEHHVDMYALANILLKTSQNPKVLALCREVKEVVRVYMNAVYEPSSGTYLIGTNERGEKLNQIDPTPVDCQTWTTLTGMDDAFAPTFDRQKKSMIWVRKNCCIHDHDRAQKPVPTDCVDVPLEKFTYTNCPTNSAYAGVRFTINGKGIQLENTGSGLMALVRHTSMLPSQDNSYAEVIAAISDSIDRLLASSAADGGMYASLWPIGDVPDYGTTGQNTGLTWSYTRTPHLASTLYCVLARLYQTNTDITQREVYNPYSTYVVTYKRSQTLKEVVFPETDFGLPYTGTFVTSPELTKDEIFGNFIEGKSKGWFKQFQNSDNGKRLRNDAVASFFGLTQFNEIMSIGENPRFLNQSELIATRVLAHLYELIRNK